MYDLIYVLIIFYSLVIKATNLWDCTWATIHCKHTRDWNCIGERHPRAACPEIVSCDGYTV